MLVGGLQLLEVASEGVDNLLDAPVLTFFVFLIVAKSLAHGAHELEQFRVVGIEKQLAGELQQQVAQLTHFKVQVLPYFLPELPL